MSTSDLIQLAIAVITVAGVFVALWVARRDGRRTRSRDDDARIRELAKEAITEALDPLRERFSEQASSMNRMGDSVSRTETGVKEILSTQRDTLDRTARLEVKVEYFWEQAAMNAAKAIHQPDPEREVIDRLLESFMEGTLTQDERLELRKYLVKIRNYEPSQGYIGFPVLPGEQSQATILLSTMDLVDPARMAAHGHASHRADV